MKKISIFIAVMVMTFTSFTALSQAVGNSQSGMVNVYPGNGPGMAGIFTLNDGYRHLRFYNNTGASIKCKAQNSVGQWVITDGISPNGFVDIGIGYVPGNWDCWFL